MKIKNLVPESVTNISGHQLLSVTINKIAYVAQRDEFVIKMIVNVTIFNYQHKNIFVI